MKERNSYSPDEFLIIELQVIDAISKILNVKMNERNERNRKKGRESERERESER
jgi:hypothetical protein